VRDGYMHGLSCGAIGGLLSPRRGADAVAARARALGLGSYGRRWTPSEAATSSTSSAPTRPTTTRSGRIARSRSSRPEAGNTAARPASAKVERRDLLGGLIHEYRAAA
jgi:hypothetical protein